jgi:hypothetical protein
MARAMSGTPRNAYNRRANADGCPSRSEDVLGTLTIVREGRRPTGIGRGMAVRYHIDPDTGEPHIFRHRVSEAEVEDVLRWPAENRPGSGDSRILIGQTRTGRYLKIICVPDEDGPGVFVVTAFDLAGKPLTAFRRRMRRRGKS